MMATEAIANPTSEEQQLVADWQANSAAWIADSRELKAEARTRRQELDALITAAEQADPQVAAALGTYNSGLATRHAERDVLRALLEAAIASGNQGQIASRTAQLNAWSNPDLQALRAARQANQTVRDLWDERADVTALLATEQTPAMSTCLGRMRELGLDPASAKAGLVRRRLPPGQGPQGPQGQPTGINTRPRRRS